METIGDFIKNDKGDAAIKAYKNKLNISNKKLFEYGRYKLNEIGNMYLEEEDKVFSIEGNVLVYKFLIMYFLGLKEAESVFPKREYKLHKNLLIMGKSGAGKSFIFKTLSQVLKEISIPKVAANRFQNASIPQITNFYKANNHLDRFTYNECSKSFEGKPFNLCINDIGLEDHLHFGTNTKSLITDLMHARSDLFERSGIKTHITTNLDFEQLKEYFKDDHGRIKDRFKNYNIIYMKGVSKR